MSAISDTKEGDHSVIDYKSKRAINVLVSLFMVDPRAFTSNRQVGLENERPPSQLVLTSL